MPRKNPKRLRKEAGILQKKEEDYSGKYYRRIQQYFKEQGLPYDESIDRAPKNRYNNHGRRKRTED